MCGKPFISKFSFFLILVLIASITMNIRLHDLNRDKDDIIYHQNNETIEALTLVIELQEKQVQSDKHFDKMKDVAEESVETLGSYYLIIKAQGERIKELEGVIQKYLYL